MDYAKLLELLSEQKDEAEIMAGKVTANFGESSYNLKLVQDLENGQFCFVVEQIPSE